MTDHLVCRWYDWGSEYFILILINLIATCSWLVVTILDGATIDRELRDLLINHNVSYNGSYLGAYSN